MLITDELKPLNGIFSVTLDALLDRGLKASDVDVPLGGVAFFVLPNRQRRSMPLFRCRRMSFPTWESL